ncbi:leucine-rich repeat-containing protein 15-like [Bacillus rossius redtenbacheri]|uniref:leucine-rich repeat-containing protein 15-like n=1 Tax=Bacillus rossius redtenbacheri TaxID=93214 RepID=UPI002FDDC6C7
MASCFLGTCCLVVFVARLATAWLIPGAVLCPEECQCKGFTFQFVDCVKTSLQMVPTNFPENVYMIEMSHNNFSKIPEKSFSGLKRLFRLEMHNCNIRYIESGSFNNLPNLAYVYLSNNKLTAITPKMFNSLESLTWLDLEKNNIGEIQKGSFSNLSSLNWLDLDSNQIVNLEDNTFLGLTNLTRMFLSYNKIEEIKNNTFLGLTSLMTLTLTKNRINRIEAGSFESLASLTTLIMDYNMMRKIDKDTFFGLGRLESLSMDNNNIGFIQRDAFVYTVNLTSLSLINNTIKELETDTFRGLKKLQHLMLSSNQITQLDEHCFEDLGNLVFLDLSRNRIHTLVPDNFKYLVSLVTLSLAGNHLRCIHPESFLDNKRLITVSLDSNGYLNLPTNESLLISSSIENLYLSSCHISYLPPKIFEQLPSLESVLLHRNNLQYFSKASFSPLKRLTHLDLYDNPLLCDCALQDAWSWVNSANITFSGRCAGPGALADRPLYRLESLDCSGTAGSRRTTGRVEDFSCRSYRYDSSLSDPEDLAGMAAPAQPDPATMKQQFRAYQSPHEATASAVVSVLVVQCVLFAAVLLVLGFVYYKRRHRGNLSYDPYSQASVDNVPLCATA